jgi:hypothetical protein
MPWAFMSVIPRGAAVLSKSSQKLGRLARNDSYGERDHIALSPTGLSVQYDGLMGRFALPNWVNTGITTGSYESSSG